MKIAGYEVCATKGCHQWAKVDGLCEFCSAAAKGEKYDRQQKQQAQCEINCVKPDRDWHNAKLTRAGYPAIQA